MWRVTTQFGGVDDLGDPEVADQAGSGRVRQAEVAVAVPAGLLPRTERAGGPAGTATDPLTTQPDWPDQAVAWVLIRPSHALARLHAGDPVANLEVREGLLNRAAMLVAQAEIEECLDRFGQARSSIETAIALLSCCPVTELDDADTLLLWSRAGDRAGRPGPVRGAVRGGCRRPSGAPPWRGTCAMSEMRWPQCRFELPVDFPRSGVDQGWGEILVEDGIRRTCSCPRCGAHPARDDAGNLVAT